MDFRHDGGAPQEPYMLTSHKLAIAIFHSVVLANARDQVTWLDVGCGPGQVLQSIEHVIGDRVKSIRYIGLDGSRQHCDTAVGFARQQGLIDPDLRCTRLERMADTVGDVEADFVTMINVAHELSPSTLAEAFCCSVGCLSPSGILHVSDQLALEKEEIDSVCWRPDELDRALCPLFDLYEWPADARRIQVWGDSKSARFWSFEVRGSRTRTSSRDLRADLETAVSELRQTLSALLVEKRAMHNRVLQAFVDEVPMTEDDRSALEHALYEYWTISNWLEDQHD